MKRLAILLLPLLHPVAAQAQEGWWRIATAPDGATRYHCGEACPDEGLVCVHFSRPGPGGGETRDLADGAYLPWGQVDFFTAAAILKDRDLDADDILGGERLEGPQILSFGDVDWVGARYGVETLADGAVSIELLLWLDGADLQGLRCSYRAGADVASLVEGLAVSLR